MPGDGLFLLTLPCQTLTADYLLPVGQDLRQSSYELQNVVHILWSYGSVIELQPLQDDFSQRSGQLMARQFWVPKEKANPNKIADV